MAAFWALFGLMAYGCLGGMVHVLDGWIGGKPWMPMFPLLGKFGLSEVVAIGVLAALGWSIHHVLNRPNVADMLIDTEGELRKVTWPNAKETWAGTIAVAVTVLVLLAFLFTADMVLTWSINRLLGVGGGGS